MLNKLCTSLGLLCFVVIAFAQDSDDKEDESNSKRPSWSAGMPERQKTADLNKPSFKPEMNDDIELDMSGFGLQEKPQVDIGLPINSNIEGLQVGTVKETSEAAEQVPEENIQSQPVAAQDTVAVEDDPVAVEDDPVDEPEEINVQAVQEPVVNVVDSTEISVPEETAEAEVVEAPAVEAVPVEQTPVVQTPVIQAPELETDTDEDEVLIIGQGNAEQNVDEPNSADTMTSEENNALPQDNSIASIDPPVSNDPQISSVATEEIEYVWNIVKQTPLEYPIQAARTNLEGWVELEVTINPAGEVVSASPKDYSSRGRVFGKPALDSVRDWLFEPPANIGITTNLTRVYKVDFTL